MRADELDRGSVSAFSPSGRGRVVTHSHSGVVGRSAARPVSFPYGAGIARLQRAGSSL